jgi:hypothetical protein
MTKAITYIVQCKPVKAGHAIELEFEFTDGSRESFECESQFSALFIGLLHRAAVEAEQIRKREGPEQVSLEVPYIAADVRAGIENRGRYVIAQFATNLGIPVGLAMAPELCRRTIGLLTHQLGRLEREPPMKRS